MKMYVVGLIAVASCQLLAQTPAPAVKVNWEQPEKYTDVRPANGTKAGYIRHVIASFEPFWQKLGNKLPAGYSVEISIKDVDLAGDVNPLYQVDHRDIRVLKDIYFPKVTLDYKLLDAARHVVDEGKDVKIKDMNFMYGASIKHASQEFSHEKNMLDKWFQTTFVNKLSDKK